MDTAVVHHRNRCTRNLLGFSQSLHLDVSCRASKSRGILPTPDKNSAIPNSSFIFKTPHRIRNRPFTSSRRTSPIRLNNKESPEKVRFNGNSLASFTEIWAGPTYSNSPPPSSLPIPSMKLKRADSPDKSLSPTSVLADSSRSLRCMLNLDLEDDVV